MPKLYNLTIYFDGMEYDRYTAYPLHALRSVVSRLYPEQKWPENDMQLLRSIKEHDPENLHIEEVADV